MMDAFGTRIQDSQNDILTLIRGGKIYEFI